MKKREEDYKFIGLESIDSDKFDRQKRIKGWDQNKISNSTVMIIGAGATGNEVIKNLVLTGIGRIILIDYDLIRSAPKVLNRAGVSDTISITSALGDWLIARDETNADYKYWLYDVCFCTNGVNHNYWHFCCGVWAILSNCKLPLSNNDSDLSPQRQNW